MRNLTFDEFCDKFINTKSDISIKPLPADPDAYVKTDADYQYYQYYDIYSEPVNYDIYGEPVNTTTNANYSMAKFHEYQTMLRLQQKAEKYINPPIIKDKSPPSRFRGFLETIDLDECEF
ncbi:hypothetical protein LCGC14_0870790 [marine sediment metagenome]|uniref:Uncharacterized protein n=1 Tax=marine sediment metagenome TaxID=412755 RepID=A0A0F9P4U2_9ZZZZ